MKYKIILYGNKIYKEILLSEEIDTLTIGTYKDCQIRLQQSAFYSSFRFTLHRIETSYTISCGEELFFSENSETREQIHELKPGDHMEIRSAVVDVPLLWIDFSIDFGEPSSDFNRRIHTSGVDQVTIGKEGYGINICNDLLEDDYLILTRIGSSYQIDTTKMRYGVEINGMPARKALCTIADHQFLCVYGTFFFIDGTDILTTAADLLQTDLPSDYYYDQTNKLRYPEFIRSTRLIYPQPKEKLEVLQPPPLPTKPKEGLIASVLPSLIMMILMMVLRSMMTSRLIYALYFAVMMGMSVIMTIVNYFRGHKEYREQVARRLEVYNDYINRKDKPHL